MTTPHPPIPLSPKRIKLDENALELTFRFWAGTGWRQFTASRIRRTIKRYLAYVVHLSEDRDGLIEKLEALRNEPRYREQLNTDIHRMSVDAAITIIRQHQATSNSSNEPKTGKCYGQIPENKNESPSMGVFGFNPAAVNSAEDATRKDAYSETLASQGCESSVMGAAPETLETACGNETSIGYKAGCPKLGAGGSSEISDNPVPDDGKRPLTVFDTMWDFLDKRIDDPDHGIAAGAFRWIDNKYRSPEPVSGCPITPESLKLHQDLFDMGREHEAANECKHDGSKVQKVQIAEQPDQELPEELRAKMANAAIAELCEHVGMPLPTRESAHRWNIEKHPNGKDLLVCENNHHRSEPCKWERWVPEREISDERGIEEMAHKYWNDTNGWKANGEAWKHTREDNREYCREYVRKIYLPWVKSYLLANTDIEDGRG